MRGPVDSCGTLPIDCKRGSTYVAYTVRYVRDIVVGISAVDPPAHVYSHLVAVYYTWAPVAAHCPCSQSQNPRSSSERWQLYRIQSIARSFVR